MERGFTPRDVHEPNATPQPTVWVLTPPDNRPRLTATLEAALTYAPEEVSWRRQSHRIWTGTDEEGGTWRLYTQEVFT